MTMCVPRWRGTGRALAALLVLAGLLTGCASIPDSGPVMPGRPVDVDPRDGLAGVQPDLPVTGAAPTEIVKGFLRAAAGFSEDHRIARRFLTPQRRLAWRPDAQVKIFPTQGSLDIHETGRPGSDELPAPQPASGAGPDVQEHVQTTRVTVRTPIQATIDGDGRYRSSGPGTVETTTFGLTRYGDGEWRISALADGILIGAVDFGVTFRSFPVYFGDPTGRFLVPDVHWFPGTRDEPGSLELPTALVRVLLDGPPPWLEGAVRTGAPPQTKMAVGAVVVTDDVATVDLTDQVRQASTRDRQLLVSQLLATLSQLRTIGAVRITVGRVAFEVPGGAGPTDPSSGQADSQPLADPSVDNRPVVIDGKGRLARLSGRDLQPVKDVDGLAVPGANRPAVASDSSAYAVLDQHRTHLLLQLPGSKAVQLVHSAGLTAPSFDPQNWVWTSPATASGFVYAAGIDPGAFKVKAPWMRTMDVVALRISRDGTRAAVAVRARGRSHVYLAGVVRDGQGRPLSLTDPIGLMPDLTSVADLAWVDEDQLVVLGSTSTEPRQRPLVVQIGGTIVTSAVVPKSESVTAGNGVLSLMVGTPAGSLARAGALWQKVSSGRWPAFPG